MKHTIYYAALCILMVLTGCTKTQHSADPDYGAKPPRSIFHPSGALLSMQNGDTHNAMKQLSFPTGLMHLPTYDGTIKLGDSINTLLELDKPKMFYGTTERAVGALDGWALSAPIHLYFTLHGQKLDQKTFAEGIKLYEIGSGQEPKLSQEWKFISSDVQSLTDEFKKVNHQNQSMLYTADYVASEEMISIIPITPLKPKTKYLMVLTNALKTTSGQKVRGSALYEYVLDEQNQLSNEAQDLKNWLNSNKGIFCAQQVKSFCTQHDVIYSNAFETQSVDEPFVALKGAMQTLPDYTPELTDIKLIEPLELTKTYEIYEGKLKTPSYIQTHSFKDAQGKSCQSLANCAELDQAYWVSGRTSPYALAYAAENLAKDQRAAFATAILKSSNQLINLDLQQSQDFPGFWDLNFHGKLEQVQTFYKKPKNLYLLWDLKGIDDKSLDPIKHITRYNPLPKIEVSKKDNQLPVRIVRPLKNKQGKDCKDKDKQQVTILMHGINSNKETMDPVAIKLTEQCVISVAIDLPFHHKSYFQKESEDGKGLTENTELLDHELSLVRDEQVQSDDKKVQSDKVPVQQPNTDQNAKDNDPARLFVYGKAFMRAQSSLVIRDALRQAVVNNLALRYALNSGMKFGDQDEVKIDDVSLVGLSLGAITGTGVAAYAGHKEADHNEADHNNFGLSSATLVAPGMNLPHFLISSPLFHETLEKELKEAWELTKAAKNGASWEQSRESFIGEFGIVMNIVLDSAEPASFAQVLAKQESLPYLIVEMVGDQVIPNKVMQKPESLYTQAFSTYSWISAFFVPNAGTEPLLLAAKTLLHKENETCLAQAPKKPVCHAALKLENGEHASLIAGEDKDGVKNDVRKDLLQTVENFVISKGKTISSE